MTSIPNSQSDVVLPRCVLCGSDDPFESGLCPSCGGASASLADTLMFLRRPTSSSDRTDRVSQLAEIAGARAATSDGYDTAWGERALMRIPRAAVHQVEAQLEKRGLQVRAVPASRAWSALPVRFFVMIAGIVVVGGYAGGASVPILLLTSPLLAVLLVMYGHIDAGRTLLAPRSHAAGLSPKTENSLLRAFAELPRGETRDALIDITRGARAALAAVAGDNTRSVVRDSVGELVEAAAATALDLARLDLTIGTLGDAHASQASNQGSWDALRERCAVMRVARVAQLADAVRVLGSISTDALDSPGAAGAQLGRVTSDLATEASAHEYAERELAALLKK